MYTVLDGTLHVRTLFQGTLPSSQRALARVERKGLETHARVS